MALATVTRVYYVIDFQKNSVVARRLPEANRLEFLSRICEDDKEPSQHGCAASGSAAGGGSSTRFCHPHHLFREHFQYTFERIGPTVILGLGKLYQSKPRDAVHRDPVFYWRTGWFRIGYGDVNRNRYTRLLGLGRWERQLNGNRGFFCQLF